MHQMHQMDEIKAFLSSNEKSLVVIGASKSGKTKCCLECIHGFTQSNSSSSSSSSNNSKQNVLVLEYDDLDTHADLVKVVSNFITTPCKLEDLIQCSANANANASANATIIDKAKLKIIFLDDVDILFSQDRYANNYIQEIITKSKPNVKVIMTCSASEERKTTDVKKKSSMVRLSTNTYQDSDQDPDPHKTYFDMNIYQVVDRLFENREKGLDDTELAASLDPTLISFMMYDNYKMYFCDNYKMQHPSSQDMNKKSKDISNAYVHTSIIEDFVFNTNDWNLAEMASIIRCHTIRLSQRDLMLKQDKINQKSKAKEKEKDTKDIQYTQITSRSAQHFNILKKTMAVSELTSSNVAYMSRLAYSQGIAKTRRLDLKTDVGAVCQAFIFNIYDSMPKKKKKILGI